MARKKKNVHGRRVCSSSFPAEIFLVSFKQPTHDQIPRLGCPSVSAEAALHPKSSPNLALQELLEDEDDLCSTFQETMLPSERWGTGKLRVDRSEFSDQQLGVPGEGFNVCVCVFFFFFFGGGGGWVFEKNFTSKDPVAKLRC